MNESNIIIRYWKAYGGCEKLLASPYFRAAIIINIILWPIWSRPYWWDDVIAFVPNLLGFSLGGFALWMAIGDDKFRKFLAEETNPNFTTPFCDINTTFVHFLVLQVMAIVVALVNKAYTFYFINTFIPLSIWPVWVWWFFSYLIFSYSITATLEAILGIYRVTNMYEFFINNPPPPKKDDSQEDNKAR
ncbi:hypothetical protein HUZ36_05180 [Pseudoalteromonas sp. McH1-7]|uniref:hypothetical protein n=1 Tax=Pseudoalteromonas sp. McH1-7 TaxID=2745574 RepID=UPI001590FED4|nr:hypothetical protein [Pseudoalteromonas sp. McH1-7]NUZ10167.1 hypothetical protein [Pseudoalteromonas sp. McH1-7]